MKNQLKLGALLSYAQMAISIVINLIYTPIMIKTLGASEYGLYNTVASTIAMLSMLSLGFNSGYVKYYVRYKKENDNDAIARLNGLFLKIFIIIGLVALVCGLFLANHLDIVFSTGLTLEEYGIAKVLMVLLTISLAISFSLSVFSNIISAHERFIVLKIVGILKTILSPLIALPLLLLGYGSIGMVTATVTVSAITDLIYAVYVIFVLKQRFDFRKSESGLFKELFIFTSFIAVNMIIDQINMNVGKMLLGRFRGTSEVAIYSVGYSLYSYYQLFSTSISSVFTPRVHRVVSGDTNNRTQRKNLTDLFVKVGRIQFLVLGLISSGVLFFGKSFIINIWAGSEYSDSYYVAILLIFPASIALIQNLGIEIQRAQNNHRFRSYVYSIMAAINLGLNIYLCQLYGVIGSTVGTAISLIIANGIIMNIYYHKRCNIDVMAFWHSILLLARGMIIPVIFGIFINIFMTKYTTLVFFSECAIYTLIYAISMWFFGMDKYEKGIIKNIMSRIRRV